MFGRNSLITQAYIALGLSVKIPPGHELTW